MEETKCIHTHTYIYVYMCIYVCIYTHTYINITVNRHSTQNFCARSEFGFLPLTLLNKYLFQKSNKSIESTNQHLNQNSDKHELDIGILLQLHSSGKNHRRWSSEKGHNPPTHFEQQLPLQIGSFRISRAELLRSLPSQQQEDFQDRLM